MKITIELNDSKIKEFFSRVLNIEEISVVPEKDGENKQVPTVRREKSQYEIYEETKNILLVDTALPVRIINCFRVYGIETLAGVLSCSKGFVCSIRNFGMCSLRVLANYLQSYGYKLGSLPPIYVDCLTSLRARRTGSERFYTDLFKNKKELENFIATMNCKIYESLKTQKNNDETTVIA